MATEWYCLIQGTSSGPHAGAELQAMADRGDLPPEAQIRRGRDGKWVRANSVKGLKFVLKPAIDSFRVKGPDLQTGRMREVIIGAATQDEAHRIAAEAGVVTGRAHDA